MSSAEVLLSAISGLLTVMCAAFGWWLMSLHDKHEALRKSHEELRVEVAGRYLSKDDVKDMFFELKTDISGLITNLRDEIKSLK